MSVTSACITNMKNQESFALLGHHHFDSRLTQQTWGSQSIEKNNSEASLQSYSETEIFLGASVILITGKLQSIAFHSQSAACRPFLFTAQTEYLGFFWREIKAFPWVLGKSRET